MKRNVRLVCVIVLAVLFATPVFAGGTGEGGAAGKPPVGPNDTIEWLVGQTPGSGQDNSSRQMEKAIRANNIIPNPIQFNYKPGANTGVAMQWLKTQAGRSDLIMYASVQLILTPLVMDVGVKREDLTDIAFFGESFQFLWVTKEKAQKEGWKTIADALKSGKPISFTANGAGSPEELTALFLKAKTPGADIRIVPVSGDGEGMTQLLGGHVDIFIFHVPGLKPPPLGGQLLA